MSTIAQLLIQVKSDGLDATIQKLNQLSGAAKSVTSAENDVSKASSLASKASADQSKAAIAATNAAIAELRLRKELANTLNAESRARQAVIREQRLQNNEASRSSGLVGALTTRVTSLAAAYVSVQSAVRLFNSTIEASAGYQTLERQLEFLTGGGVAAATKELGYLTDVSNRYGTVLLQSTESYAALASAMKLSGVSMQGVHQTYEALSAVSATYALSQDKVNAIMLAFTQIAGKGRVQSEELVRQLGQYIPALQLGAQAMGMSIRDFNKALKEGSVASADFLPKFAALIQAMYGRDIERKTDTITASMNRLTTSWQQFLNTSSNTSGVVSAWKSVLEAASVALNVASGNDPRKFIEDYAAAAVDAKDKIGTLEKGASALFTLIQRGPANWLFLDEVPDQVNSVSDAFHSLFNSEKLASDKLAEFELRASLLNSDQLRVGIAAVKGKAESSGSLTYGGFDAKTGARSETWDKQSAEYETLVILNKEYHKRIADQDKEAEKERVDLIGTFNSKIETETDEFLTQQSQKNLSSSDRVVLSYQKQIDAIRGYIDKLKELKAPLNDVLAAERRLSDLINGKTGEITAGLSDSLAAPLTDEIDKINKKYDDMIASRRASLAAQPGEWKTLEQFQAEQVAMKSAEEQINAARDRDIDAYKAKQGAALASQTEALRISILDGKDQIKARYDFEVEEAKKTYGTNGKALDRYLDLLKQKYEKDEKAFDDIEKQKTDALAAQLLKRYGKYTAAGVEARFAEQRTAASKITDPTQKAAVLSGIDVDENKTKLEAIQESYKNEQNVLQLQLDQRRITEEEYQNASIENWKKYQSDMEGVAGGAKIVQQENLQGWAQITSGMENNMSQIQSLTKQGTAANKAAYLASRALAVAGILINTQLAAAQAESQTGNIFLGMTLSQLVRAEGYASAALTAAMIPAGYATGGTLGDARDTQPGVIRGPGTGTSDSIYFRGSAWESIITANATKGIGVAAVDYINRNNRLPPGHNEGATLRRNGYGYANGGTLGYSAPIPLVNASSNVSVPIQINNTSDSTVTAKRQTVNGQTIVQIAVAQAKAELYNDVASWNGPMANALSAQGVRRG